MKISEIKFFFCLVLFNADPSHVIGLYPNLLPPEFRNKLDYPEKVPDLNGLELDKGTMALIEYLTQVIISTF